LEFADAAVLDAITAVIAACCAIIIFVMLFSSSIKY